MQPKSIDNILKVWKTKNTILEPNNPTYDIKIIEQIATLFAPSKFYYYIVNFMDFKIAHVGGACQEVLGIGKENITLEALLNLFHPEDSAILEQKEMASLNFLLHAISREDMTKYKTVYLWRIQLKNGEQKTILHQAQALDISKDGKIQNALSVDTDVTHLNIPIDHKISFISNEKPSYTGLDPNEPFHQQSNTFKQLFTPRELEIIDNLSLGHKNPQIADQLNISVHTVKTHKRNILRKSECKNTPQLITRCIREGLI